MDIECALTDRKVNPIVLLRCERVLVVSFSWPLPKQVITLTFVGHMT
jgi:hypothetical protein